MPYDFPAEFLEGRTAIRTGERAQEFVDAFNQVINPEHPTFAYISNFSFMTNQYGNDVAFNCTISDTQGPQLEWCYGKWYLENGYAVIDFDQLQPQQSLDCILDLL